MPTMSQCIREAGAFVKVAIDQANPVLDRIADREIGEIVMCGSGSSYHAAAMARDLMQDAAGVPVSVMYPFESDGRRYPDAARTLMIGISQSGTSTSTLRAMRAARAAGCATVAVSTTDDEGTVINAAADYVLTVPCGAEADLQPKTEGTVCMAASLVLLGLACARRSGSLAEAECARRIGDLARVADNMDAVIAASEAWVAVHGELVARSRDIKIVGSRRVYGAVLEGGLKFLETLRAPVAVYEVEEFIHGPYNSANEDSLLILVGEPGSLIERLAPVVRPWSPTIACVCGTSDGSLDFALPGTGIVPYLGFEVLLWLYVICDRVSALKGIDTMVTKDPMFHAKLGSKVLRR